MERSTSGIALIMVLAVVMLLAGIFTVIVATSVRESESERLASARETADSRLNTAEVWLNAALEQARAQLRTELNNQLPTNGAWASRRFAFGDGSNTPSLNSVTTAISTTLQNFQQRLDGQFCAQTTLEDIQVAVFVTSQACGQNLASGIALSPVYVEGPANTGQNPIQRYRVPFVAQLEHNKVKRLLRGSFEFEVGTSRLGDYAYLLHNPYDSNGVLGVFGPETNLEGRVHVNGPLGIRNRPWFTQTVSTASCSALGLPGQGCNAPATPSGQFFYEGAIRATAMTPTATNPCYAQGDCPVFASGVDWGGPVVAADVSKWSGRTYSATDTSLIVASGDYARIGLLEYPNPSNPSESMVYAYGCSTIDFYCTNYLAGEFVNYIYRDGRINNFRNVTIGRTPMVDGKPLLRIIATGSIGQLQARVPNGFMVEVVGWNGVKVDTADYGLAPCVTGSGRQNNRFLASRCERLEATNQLAVLAVDGDVTFTSAGNTRVQGSFISFRGAVGADTPTSGGARGDLFVVGNIVAAQHRAWGQINSAGVLQNGYNLRLTYDPRFAGNDILYGMSPLFQGVLSVTLQLEGRQ